MERRLVDPRPMWRERCEEVGFHCHTADGQPYWGEGIYYAFSQAEQQELEEVTLVLHDLCLEAVEHVLRKERLRELGIPQALHQLIYQSWDAEEEGIYGRFDLCYAGHGKGAPKLFEYNADTPTSILEAAVVQWFWLKDCLPNLDQFNSIHEELVANWQYFLPSLGKDLYFTSTKGHQEDFDTVSYLAKTAAEAGFTTKFIATQDIGLHHGSGRFVDSEGHDIRAMFKLYPWEWLGQEEFAGALHGSQTRWLEPPWKVVMSGKGILPILWELFPGHPNLLAASFDPASISASGNIVRKQLFGREGSQVTLFAGSVAEYQSSGRRESARNVFQQRCDLPKFAGKYPVIGSWMIGDQAAGLGIREDSSPITKNYSLFVPHAIV